MAAGCFRGWAALIGALSMATAPGAALAQAAQRELWVANNCRYPVRILYYHEHADGSWATHGWYTVPANQTAPSQIVAGSRPLMHIDGRPLYFYAEATNNPKILWEGDRYANFENINYGTLLAEVYSRGGNLNHTLGCDGL